MAGKTNYDKLKTKFAQKKQMLADMEDDRWWKPTVPSQANTQLTQRVRFLPPPDGFDSWYVEYGVHYRIKNEAGDFISITCPKKTLNKPCPICEFVKGLWKTGEDKDKAMASSIGCKTRYCSNVIVLGENASEVKVWAYGSKVWTPLNELCVGDSGEVIPFDDPQIGFNIKITVGLQQTAGGDFPSYTVLPEMKPCAIPDKSVLGKLNPIHELITKRIKSYDEIRAILYGTVTEDSEKEVTKKTVEEGSESEPATATTEPTVEEEQPVVTEKEPAHAETVEKVATPASVARPTREDLIKRATEAAKRKGQ